MKYNRIKIFTVSMLTLMALTSYGTKYQKAVACADKKAQQKYYAMAADKYECLLHCKKTPADSLYAIRVKLANCYMKMGNTIKAEANYAEVVKTGKADAQITFSYARSLESNGKYQDAKDQFDKVADDASLKGKYVKGFSEASEKALHASRNDKYDIVREGFNTSASEYAPAYYMKGIVYTSNKNERFSGASQRTMWNKERFTDLYVVHEDNKGDLKSTDKLPSPINSKLNDGAAVFNAAYDEVFITRNNKKCKQHDQLQILWSKYDGTNWSTPAILSFEMPGASYAHPSLSADGNTLYFSSDQASSTIGGMDIYMTRRNGTAWESPVSLGDAINTTGNETFPYIAADSSLYFTSDGWPGYGGMDVFHAKFKDGKFEKPENMGTAFNSSKDDLSAIVDTKNRTGYFASNRDGDDDIFSFRLSSKKPMDDKDKDEKKKEAAYSGKIVDKTTGQPIPGARVEVYSPGNPTGGAFYYTNDKGEFYYTKKMSPNDEIKVIKDKYTISTMNAANIADSKSFEVSMEAAPAETPVAPVRSGGLTTLYYDVNKFELTNTNMDLLSPVVQRMKNNPDNHVYINGFADESGSDKYNFGLSNHRVQTVVDYLTGLGVNAEKIHSAFFGAVKLSPKCRQTPACVKDTDRENRRVEIYISTQ